MINILAWIVIVLLFVFSIIYSFVKNNKKTIATGGLLYFLFKYFNKKWIYIKNFLIYKKI